MPQKKAKKSPKAPLKGRGVEKAKKFVKTAKSRSLGAAVKSVAKRIIKVAATPAKRKAGPLPKGSPMKSAVKAVVKGKIGASAVRNAVVPEKARKEGPKKERGRPSPAISVKPGVKGKKSSELVVVVAAKGVALLAKEGRPSKRGKAASEALAARARRCREPGCDHDFTIQGYCRLHYIKNWRRLKRKETILASGQLNNYVEELVNKYPDRYLDVIRQDLASEKDWAKVVVDLELDGADEEASGEDEIDAAAEGVRAPVGGGRGEFDDEGDAF